jgi:hypothetical protein
MLVFRWKWAVVADPRCGPVLDNRTPNYLYMYHCVYIVIFDCMFLRYSGMCYEVRLSLYSCAVFPACFSILLSLWCLLWYTSCMGRGMLCTIVCLELYCCTV